VQLTGPDDCFLREHFEHSLRAHLLHGDIFEDYPLEDVVRAVDDLGLWERDDEEAPFDDPRWNTELGKEILECQMRLKFAGYESPSDSEDGS
jgi:hypothetical protein